MDMALVVTCATCGDRLVFRTQAALDAYDWKTYNREHEHPVDPLPRSVRRDMERMG